MNAPHLLPNFAEGKSAAPLLVQLRSPQGLSVLNAVEYVLFEERGNKVLEFVAANLGNKFSIIEHFHDFFRLKLESEISIGKIFAQFEQH